MRTLTIDTIKASSVIPNNNGYDFIDIDGTTLLTLSTEITYGDSAVITGDNKLYKLDSNLRSNEVNIPRLIWTLNNKLNGFGITIKAAGLYYLNQIKNKVYIGSIELK